MRLPKPSITIEIPGKPQQKDNSTKFRAGQKKPYIGNKKAVLYEQDVHWIALEAMRDAGWPGPWAGRVGIVANFRFGTYLNCDIPNYWKSLLDGLNGSVYDDDSQIDFTMQARQKDPDNPGVTIYIYFYDYDHNDNKKRPHHWDEFKVEECTVPEFYDVIRDPADALPCRFAQFGLGRLGEARAAAAVRKREERKRQKIDNHVKGLKANDKGCNKGRQSRKARKEG